MTNNGGSDSVERQTLTDDEKRILEAMRANPGLQNQFLLLWQDLRGGGSSELSLDKMESIVVERVRSIGQEIIAHEAQAQEQDLAKQARAKNAGARLDRKKNSNGEAPLEK